MKITDSIDLIDGTMGNCYSVRYGDRDILIDAGTRGSGKKIISYYEGKGSGPEFVLITHYHPDHVGGLKAIQEKFSPKIYVPDLEINVISGNERMTPANSFMSKLVAGMMKTSPVKDVAVASSLSLEGFSVLSTPGHTPGSTSYFFEPDSALFVGDAVVIDGSGMKINKAFTLDMDTALRSRKAIEEFPAKLILSGHGKTLRR